MRGITKTDLSFWGEEDEGAKNGARPGKRCEISGKGEKREILKAVDGTQVG